MTVEEKRFLWNFVFESDLIEGIRNDPKRLRDEIVNEKKDGHVGAMFLLHRLASEHKKFLDEATVREIQRLIIAEQPEKEGGKKLQPWHVGAYRKVGASVVARYSEPILSAQGNICDLRYRIEVVRQMPSSRAVPALMKKWIRRVNHWQRALRRYSVETSVRKIADFHFEFEFIHPFADGNGRTGRALAYYMLMYAGCRPFLFTEYDKQSTYYPCFRDETKRTIREYFSQRVFHPELVTGRIETMSAEDVLEF